MRKYAMATISGLIPMILVKLLRFAGFFLMRFFVWILPYTTTDIVTVPLVIGIWLSAKIPVNHGSKWIIPL